MFFTKIHSSNSNLRLPYSDVLIICSIIYGVIFSFPNNPTLMFGNYKSSLGWYNLIYFYFDLEI